MYKPTDNDTDKLYDHIWSIIKKDESNKEVILKTVKDVIGILAGLEISQNEDEPNANDSSANDLTNQRNENMAELEKALRSIVNINMIMIENKIEPIITQTNIIEEEEPLEQVQTHTLVLENVDISILNNLKDQHGHNIKQSEVHEDTSEESEEAEEIKAKTQTCHSRYHNVKNVRKCFSCPNLPGEKQAEFSDSAFTQTFVQQCQEEAEDVGISEGRLVKMLTCFNYISFCFQTNLVLIFSHQVALMTVCRWTWRSLGTAFSSGKHRLWMILLSCEYILARLTITL